MKLGKRLLAFYAVIVLLSGCAAVQPAGEQALTPPTVIPSTLRAKAVVEMTRNMTIAGRASILVKAPGSFRIEVTGPFGQTAMLLASDGARLYTSSDGKVNEFLWGDPEIPYSFEADEAVAFLTGSPRPLQAALPPNVIEKRDNWGRLKEYTKAVEGRPGLKVTLGNYKDINGAHIPFLIRIEDGRRTLAIKYSEVEVNPPIDEGLFSLEARSDRGSKEVD